MKQIARFNRLLVWFGWSAWVVASMIFGGLISGFVIGALFRLGLMAQIHSTTATLVQGVVAYIFALIVLVSVPWLIKRNITSTSELGIRRTLTWTDIGMSLAGFITYVLTAMVVLWLIVAIVPSFDVSQVQNLGFDRAIFGGERALAFVVLVIIAPVVEEIIFRGYLYGKLRASHMPMWLVMATVSVIFGAIHGQWNVGVDVFVLSMVACILRETTGSIWAGVLVHMMKNAVAFYVLFISMTSVG